MKRGYITQGRGKPAAWLIAVATVVALSLFVGCNPFTLEDATVMYDGNGSTAGSVPVDSMVYLQNMDVTVLGNSGALVRTGYSFKGWNTDSAGTGTVRIPGSLFAIGSADVVLYAKWGTEDITMIDIPGGSFMMGSPYDGVAYTEEQPYHSVTLEGFLMGQTEVTQGQYLDVVGSNPSYFAAEPNNSSLPVELVSWYDAVEFSNALSQIQGFESVYTITDKVYVSGRIDSATVVADLSKDGYRLPTEEEWEYAALGGDGSPGAFVYSGSDTIDDVAWYHAVSDSLTHQVMVLAPNELGLYDMSGNVWEWSHDWLVSYDPEAANNPMMPAPTMRVYRGGSYVDVPDDVRNAHRSGGLPKLRGANNGFRLVRRPVSAAL